MHEHKNDDASREKLGSNDAAGWWTGVDSAGIRPLGDSKLLTSPPASLVAAYQAAHRKKKLLFGSERPVGAGSCDDVNTKAASSP